MEITTSKCILREWRDSDAIFIAENANNKKISDNVSDIFPHPYSVKDAKEWIEKSKNQTVPQTQFAIVVDGKAVGSIGFVKKDDIHRKNLELGYFIGEDYWGMGIVTEAVKAITEYAFQFFDVERIYAECFPLNIASKRVLEKAGYMHEATLHNSIFKNNALFDSFIYACYKTP